MKAFSNPIPTLKEGSLEIDNLIGEEIAYKKGDDVYFAFIDILGFKQTSDEELKQGATAFKNTCKLVFEYYFSLINASRFNESNKCYAGQISDSLYFYTKSEMILVDFLKLFSYFNLFAMSENVFFRGGVARGELFVKEPHQFYGNSVIYAYLLESVVAQRPTIYFSEEVHNALKDSEIRNGLIEQGHRFFLSPFLGYQFDIKDILQHDVSVPLKSISDEVKEKIRKNIDKNITKFQYDNNNFEKYIFLLNKFNEAGRKNG